MQKLFIITMIFLTSVSIAFASAKEKILTVRTQGFYSKHTGWDFKQTEGRNYYIILNYRGVPGQFYDSEFNEIYTPSRKFQTNTSGVYAYFYADKNMLAIYDDYNLQVTLVASISAIFTYSTCDTDESCFCLNNQAFLNALDNIKLQLQ